MAFGERCRTATSTTSPAFLRAIFDRLRAPHTKNGCPTAVQRVAAQSPLPERGLASTAPASFGRCRSGCRSTIGEFQKRRVENPTQLAFSCQLRGVIAAPSPTPRNCSSRAGRDYDRALFIECEGVRPMARWGFAVPEALLAAATKTA
jgi:hypothetical protein